MKTRPEKPAGADSFRVLFRTIGRLRLPWVWIAAALALNLALETLMLRLPDTTADLMSGQLSGAATAKAILYYIVLGLLSFVMVAGQVQAQTYGIRRARQSLWNKMLGMRMSYFDRNDPSDQMSAIINDAGSAVNDLVNVIIYLIPSVYYVVMALRRIGSYHWLLAVSCFAVLPLKYLYALVMGRQMQKGTAKVYGRIGVLTGFLADRINHLPLIKAYTNEKAEIRAGEETARGLRKAQMKLVFLDNVASAAVTVMDILQKFIVIVLAVVLLQRGEIELSMWVAFFLFAQNLFPNMDQVFDTWVRFKGIHGSFRRVCEIMDGEDEEPAALAFPETGDIRFDHVTFTYPDTDAPALADVSFTVPRGGAVAIVGLCGSGKTTSISLLERFYLPDEGHIFIGDTDVREIALGDFRRRIAYVQQGADVFGGTLREALTYGIGREVTDEEILAAAEKTGFAEYLAQIGNDLDAEVAPGGDSMSGGQSQRLVLTRELLRGGDIVLMDEPTSALDVRVSARIQDTMDTVFADKTRILITHDLALARRYGRILVMDGGRLCGDGSHEELLEHCGTYRRMNEDAEEEEGNV